MENLTKLMGRAVGSKKGLLERIWWEDTGVREILGALKTFPLESNASKRAKCSAIFSDIAENCSHVT